MTLLENSNAIGLEMDFDAACPSRLYCNWQDERLAFFVRQGYLVVTQTGVQHTCVV